MGKHSNPLETSSTTPTLIPHPEGMDKVDWKFVLVLAVHLLAVGVMYGRMSAQQDVITEKVSESKLSIDGLRLSVDAFSNKMAILETQRSSDAKAIADNASRLNQLEREYWDRHKLEK